MIKDQPIVEGAVGGTPAVEHTPEEGNHNTLVEAQPQDILEEGVVLLVVVAAEADSRPAAVGTQEYQVVQGRNQLEHRGYNPQAWACRGCKASACCWAGLGKARGRGLLRKGWGAAVDIGEEELSYLGVEHCLELYL